MGNKKARGKLRKLMDENKAAAAAEVQALSAHLHTELDKARAKNAHNKIAMAKDLTEATELFYEKLAAQQKAQDAAHATLGESIDAATVASANALARAQEDFDSKIVMLTDTVAQHAAAAKREFTRITGVVNDYNAVAEADRALLKEETKALEADLNKALDRAISIGEARARAVAFPPLVTSSSPSASWRLCTLLLRRVSAWVVMSFLPSSPARPSTSPALWLLSTAS